MREAVARDAACPPASTRKSAFIKKTAQGEVEPRSALSTVSPLCRPRPWLQQRERRHPRRIAPAEKPRGTGAALLAFLPFFARRGGLLLPTICTCRNRLPQNRPLFLFYNRFHGMIKNSDCAAVFCPRPPPFGRTTPTFLGRGHRAPTRPLFDSSNRAER